jgi:hypothetical protein
LFIGLMALGGWIFKVEGIRYVANQLIRRLGSITNPQPKP